MQTYVYKQAPPPSPQNYAIVTLRYVRSRVGIDGAYDQLDTCTGIYKDVQLKSKLQRPGNLSAHRCVRLRLKRDGTRAETRFRLSCETDESI